ncbi:MgtC/SapB family protein [candidate division WOR-3 bacterium]|nr:MgtC/SapB family protein [candidate division WOR-3 bacterium]
MEGFLDASWKLGLALLLSAIVGIERSIADKPAGIRTLMLVGFGSALFMVIAEKSGFDASRLAAGIVTGVGFLGAGTIIREGGTVHGLTTAASIWAVAGIGIASAKGLWLLAVLAAVGVLIVLWGVGFLENVLDRGWDSRHQMKKRLVRRPESLVFILLRP